MLALTKALAMLSTCFAAQIGPAEPIVGAPPEKPLSSMVFAELRPDRTLVPVGGRVMVEFVLVNKTDEPVKLTVPGALVGVERNDQGLGLPLEHVFSASEFRGLEIASESNPRQGDRVTRKPEFPVPPITLAPFGSAGLRFDVARFYPALHQSGIYHLGWRPYAGELAAAPITIEVVQYKQVLMETEYGTIGIQLLYDKAPRHVANFLDLVDARFYNGKTFHRVFRDQFILGGSPEGRGIGKRPDGVTVPPEFNDTPFQLGTVGMALKEGDANSGSCQFFICLSRQPAWDGRYTAFAQISGPESLSVLRKLGEVEIDANGAPTKPLVIKSMRSVDVPAPPTQAP